MMPLLPPDGTVVEDMVDRVSFFAVAVVPRSFSSSLEMRSHARVAGPQPEDRLVGPVVKASASRAEDPEFESRLRRDFSGVKAYQLALRWLPCQAPGVIGSVLGLVGPVSVYRDWVRWKVWSVT